MASNLIDLPIESSKSDTLDVKVFVKALTDFIAYAETPMTIAIQGEWGSGKTSFMKLLWEQLCSETDNKINDKKETSFFGIWCHAWEYALFNEPQEILINLMQGLILEIQNEVSVVNKNNAKLQQALQAAGKLIKYGLRVGLHMAVASAGVPPVELSEDASEKDEKPVSIHELSKLLNTIVINSIKASKQIGKQKKGFIFFIDDLDRLDPVVAVQFLEILKNIFDLKHCIFVLAIDYEVVVRGLKPRIGERT